MYLEWVRVIISFLALLVLISGLIVAGHQFIRIRKTHSAQIVLDLQGKLLDSERRLIGFATKINEEESVNDSKVKKDLVQLLPLFDHERHLYYDLMDKLCFFILHKYIVGNEWQSEYKNTILDLVEVTKNKEIKIEDYQNICDLYQKWTETIL